MASHSDRRSAWGFARLDHPPTGFREQAGQGDWAGAKEAADGVAKTATRRRAIFANLPHRNVPVLSNAFQSWIMPNQI